MNTATAKSASNAAASLVRARVAVSIAFFIPGCGIGLWAVHIPVIAGRLAIEPGTIGLALLAAAIGSVGAMPTAGVFLGRIGSRLPTAWLAILFAVMIPMPILAPNTPFLFVSLFVFGAVMGGLDVSMNTQAAEVEAARGRPTMSSFHGFYSLGALVGAALGGAIVGAGWGGGSGATLTAVILFAFGVWAAMNLWRSARPVAGGPRFALPPAALLSLGAITFLAFAAEGGVTDWSALFLAKIKQSGEAVAASGIVAFSIAMVVFRLSGDRLVARIGGAATVVGGGLLIATGLAVAIVMPLPLASAAGFGLVGIGAANIAPVAFSAAARVPGVPSGVGVAAVTTTGYGGFLIFPPLLGFVAEAWGLSASLALVAVMGLAVATLAGAVRRR